MVPDWQFYTAVGGLFLTVLVSAVGLAYWLGRRFEGIRSSLAALHKQVNNHLVLLGTLTRILHRRKALDDQEFQEIIASYSSVTASETAPLISEELRRQNPLTREEVERLDNYMKRAQSGYFFTPDEVRDYNELVATLERDRPNDPSVWPLVALGAFLLGLFIGSQKEK